jgi:ABC-type uncharacterized transport system permease subunit
LEEPILNEWLAALTGAGYTVLALLYWRGLLHPINLRTTWLWRILGLLVMTSHAYLLHAWIDQAHGQNLGLSNVFSQVAWLCALLIWLLSLKNIQWHLQILTYLLAGGSILFEIINPDGSAPAMARHPQEIIHILLAMLSLGVVFLAALQALLVVLNERVLRNTRFARYLHVFAPLESMETFLFQLIWVGFIVLLSSSYVFHDLWGTRLISKTVISIITWLVFAGLLFGRYLFGWRGVMATRLTLMGMLLLGCLMVFSLNYSGL